MFGAATEFSLPSNVELLAAEVGPFFSPISNTLVLGGRVNNNTAYAFGMTFKAGTTSSASGSGVLVKLRLRATAAGTATFAFDRSKLEMTRSDGSPIANFSGLAIEDLTVTIRALREGYQVLATYGEGESVSSNEAYGTVDSSFLQFDITAPHHTVVPNLDGVLSPGE
ncbi:MAG: hypothetical protein C4326_15120 [Ignavibacteria bacterium]